MIRTARPAIDPRIAPAFGVTRFGQPISYNRAPAPDLAPWIARLSVARLGLPPGQALECGLFTDTAAVRVQLAGSFTADTRDGRQHFGRSALFCGPLSRIMPVRVEAEFVSVAVALRPSAYIALLKTPLAREIDRVAPFPDDQAETVLARLEPDGTPEEWLLVLEDLMREHVATLDGALPEPITARFEEIAYLDPAMSIDQAAREIGVERRRLERLVVRDFGMPPKQVLKRARALDMASYLRGVADDDEAEALALRYYDESHLIREFIELFGMSPRQFIAQPQPLLTLTLEFRQARRLEMLNRLAAGAKRPWE